MEIKHNVPFTIEKCNIVFYIIFSGNKSKNPAYFVNWRKELEYRLENFIPINIISWHRNVNWETCIVKEIPVMNKKECSLLPAVNWHAM